MDLTRPVSIPPATSTSPFQHETPVISMSATTSRSHPSKPTFQTATSTPRPATAPPIANYDRLMPLPPYNPLWDRHPLIKPFYYRHQSKLMKVLEAMRAAHGHCRWWELPVFEDEGEDDGAAVGLSSLNLTSS
ncbi:hypothetical protein H2203_008292 [Taxawa tesnikishii (nom. ined.)]|nr:hypothetical protein H2203_008292 [Dothideales sp. JES 119]